MDVTNIFTRNDLMVQDQAQYLPVRAVRHQLLRKFKKKQGKALQRIGNHIFTNLSTSTTNIVAPPTETSIG